MLRRIVSKRIASPLVGCVRNLNLHEYQSVQLMRKFGVGTPKGDVASSADEAETIAKSIGKHMAVKAQVLAGGRGLGKFGNGFESGVHIVETPDEVKKVASKMIGQSLITKQTDEDGQPCSKVLVVEKIEGASEKYFAIMMDRESLGPIVVASAVGGVTIEDIAEKTPEKIIKEPVSIKEGMSLHKATKIAEKMNFTSTRSTQDAAQNIMKLYTMFLETDATMVEVNPLTETKDGRIIAVDAKVNFDDNAAFRQKEIFSQRDFTQENEHEVLAAKFDLNYVHLTGNIGCMVNGAGLAMATMDICKLYGGDPANFLDVGGGASEKQVYEAFKILMHEPRVKCILVNIFGGIMRCDTIATGVINAAKQLQMKVPVVVRLQGTNVDLANDMLAKSGLNLIRASDLDEAAQKAVAAAKAQA